MSTKQFEIITHIKWRVHSGVYKPGEKIPSETTFAANFSCTRPTVRKSLEKLIEEGYLVSKKGSGHFVSESKCKLNHSSKGESDSKNTVQLVNHITFNDEQINKFIEMDTCIKNKISKLKYGFYKTYINQCDDPFIIVQSMVNADVIPEESLHKMDSSFSAMLSLNGVRIKRRIEWAIVSTPPLFIKTKLGLFDNDINTTPTIYSIMYDEAGEIVELAIQYTQPEEFVMKKEIFY